MTVPDQPGGPSPKLPEGPQRLQKSPASTEVIMSEMVMSGHINGLGTVFGGTVLSWADIAAAISAQKFSSRIVVTASIDSMHFLAPIKLGWIVHIYSKVNFASRTSCEVGVKVISENTLTSETYHNCTGYFTMVAIDHHGKPVMVPKITPETSDDLRRYEAAKIRRARRIALRCELQNKSLS